MGLAQGHRAELGRRLRPEPRGSPHSPVELIVVVVDSPPEVEPGEREAEGADQEQEPQAFPLQEQSRAEQRVVSQRAALLGQATSCPPFPKPQLPEGEAQRSKPVQCHRVRLQESGQPGAGLGA